MPFTYEYPRPSVTVDCVVFAADSRRDRCDLSVLLVRRGEAPFKDRWALPGGFVQMGESLDDAAVRELAEETGVTGGFLEQLYTFGEPHRDPRGRVISIAYYALLKRSDVVVRAGSDAKAAGWFDAGKVPQLAFDHRQILQTAIARLRAKVRYAPIGFNLLPEKFALSQLQALYETILERPLDKRNFRKRLLAMDLLVEAGEESDVPHRAATLYRFDADRYEHLTRRGFNFEL